jgi:hypothetical protein
MMSIIGMEFIFEFATPYTFAALSSTGGIATLDHESLHISMEDGIVVVTGSA